MKHVYKPRIIALVCCAVLLLTGLIGGGMAKYVQEVGAEGTGASFELQLAEAFVAQESTAEMQGDGSYKVVSGSAEGNSYWLIPGTVIAKNPSITITDKTVIPAYLYAVVTQNVVDSVGENYKDSEGHLDILEYATVAEWQLVEKTTEDGMETAIFVYCENTAEEGADPNWQPLLIDNTTTLPEEIHVLKDDAVVNRFLERATDGHFFNVWGVLIQNTAGKNVEAVWAQEGSKVLKDTTTNMLEILFDAASVACQIQETPKGSNGSLSGKEDVYVENMSDIPVLVRAKIVVNWIDPSRNNAVVATPVPAADDYEISLGSKWTPINGYYYYNEIVPVDGETANLINSIKPVTGSPYKLQVEIIAEAIQATGFEDPTADAENLVSAAEAAWKHSFNDGTWN